MTLTLAMFVGLCLASLSRPLAAMEVEFAGNAVKRDILVLFDSRQEGPMIQSRVHRFAEMPLNHLGYKLTYVDVNQPLPSPDKLEKYRAILTWFVEPLAKADRIAAWLDRTGDNGLRHIIMGSVAPPADSESEPAVRRILARLGLRDGGGFVNLTYQAKIEHSDPQFIGFERPVDKALPDFPAFVASGNGVVPRLTIKVPVDGQEQSVVVVATNKNGGYAAQHFTFYYEKNTDRVRWILNPFTFFKAALGADRFPIPDTTTLAGNRIYFSHIDGDGWNNLTEIEKYRARETLSAEVIEREAIKPYPDLPVSVALLSGDTEIDLGGNPKSIPIAKRLYALPQVEVASHTHTHPYDWQFFRKYNRKREMHLVDRFQRPSAPLRKRFNAALLRLAHKKVPADRFNKYVAGTDDLPRTYLKRPFKLEIEVDKALRILRSLAPSWKKPALYQWSGDTTPFPAAIRATRKAGLRNINGGDSRFDWEFPSVAYVPAISRVTGGERQIYAVNSNENTYTNDWTGPYYGFFMLENTLKNTDRPRRLKAFNLYYHMYSGEKPSALASVKHFLNLARNSDVIPIKASHYATIADDYFNTRIEQIDLSTWAVSNRGAMQTMRFDDAANLSLDYARSSGILGTTRHEGSLYIALDEAMPRAVITLKQTTASDRGHPPVGKFSDTDAITGNSKEAAPMPQLPAGGVPSAARAAGGKGSKRLSPDAPHRALYLVRSRWNLSHLVEQGCGLSVKAQGYGYGKMVWLSRPGQGFVVTAKRAGKLLFRETKWADSAGFLKVQLRSSALQPVDLRFACHE